MKHSHFTKTYSGLIEFICLIAGVSGLLLTSHITEALICFGCISVLRLCSVLAAKHLRRKTLCLTDSLLPGDVLLHTDSGDNIVPLSTLMPGDTILLSEGQLVPADCVLLDDFAEFEAPASFGFSENITLFCGDEVAGGLRLLSDGQIFLKAATSYESSAAASYIQSFKNNIEALRLPSCFKRMYCIFMSVCLAAAAITAVLPLYTAGITVGYALYHCFSILLVCASSVSSGRLLVHLYRPLMTCFHKGALINDPAVIFKLARAKAAVFSDLPADSLNSPDSLLSFLKHNRIFTLLLSNKSSRASYCFDDIKKGLTSAKIQREFMSLKKQLKSKKPHATTLYVSPYPMEHELANMADCSVLFNMPFSSMYHDSADILIFSKKYTALLCGILKASKNAVALMRLHTYALLALKAAIVICLYVSGIPCLYGLAAACLTETVLMLIAYTNILRLL